MEKITGSMMIPVFWKICAMFPVPLGEGGMTVAAFPLAVQAKVVFSTLEATATLACEFEQIVSDAGVVSTSGTGYIGIGFDTNGVPGEQALAVGITVKVTVSMVKPVLVKVVLILFPFPLAVFGVILGALAVALHAKVVPGTAEVSCMLSGNPEQRLGVV